MRAPTAGPPRQTTVLRQVGNYEDGPASHPSPWKGSLVAGMSPRGAAGITVASRGLNKAQGNSLECEREKLTRNYL